MLIGNLQQSGIVAVSEKCGLTPAQVRLSWLRQRGVAVVPKTVREACLIETFQLAELPNQCLQAPNNLHRDLRQARLLSIEDRLALMFFMSKRTVNSRGCTTDSHCLLKSWFLEKPLHAQVFIGLNTTKLCLQRLRSYGTYMCTISQAKLHSLI